ncbi:MAG: TonB-dependent receptor [Burkholderiales bacterium]|nr:TonB-dependent receptor [Burkholderiales bacterium]
MSVSSFIPEYKIKPLALALALCCSATVAAQESELPRIDVFAKKAAQQQPGSVAVISKEKLEVLQPLSTQDALKTVPGVTVREEEGYGFIPNIGMRGLNSNRSQKVLVLEDGAPVAPSLFLANESYYSPRVERMEEIEVLKGAAGLRYGPTTIGGVINYKTKRTERGAAVTAKVGSHGYRLLGVDAGGANAKADMIGGISLVSAKGDGFRHNAFDMTDVVLKGGMALDENNWISAKATRYDNKINTSYVGLSPNEYLNTPEKNSAPNDFFLTDRSGIDFNHELTLSKNAQLNTLLYWSELRRDYWRREVDKRTADTTTFKACDGKAYCMNGNNRTFDMLGVDSRLQFDYAGFGFQNEAEIGVRLHQEHLTNQKVGSKTDVNARTGDMREDVRSSAKSLALFGQNRFLITPDFAATVGVRVESYQQDIRNQLKSKSGETSNTEFVPGLGLTWQLQPQTQLFAGIHKGFSPAMVATAVSPNAAGDYVDQLLDAERSTNFELGLRGNQQALRYEVTLFQLDFANQIVNQSVAAGVTKANGGQTIHRGLEAGLGLDLGEGWSVDSNATYVPTAKFNNVVNGLGPNGNRIPYTPKLTGNLSLNYQMGGLKTSLSANYQASQFVDAANTVLQSVDGRKGEIDAFTTVSLNAQYQVNPQLSVFGTVRNLADKKYIVSRNPDGIFPGAVRNIEVGMRYKF